MSTKRGEIKRELAALRAKREREYSKLFNNMDKIQNRLDRISHFQRDHDSILNDIKKRNDREFGAEKLLQQSREPTHIHEPNWPLVAVMAFIAILATSVFAFYPSFNITGHAVANSDPSSWIDFSGIWNTTKVSMARIDNISISSNSSLILGTIVLIGIIGGFLSRVEHKHKTRHDKYKHPLMITR